MCQNFCAGCGKFLVSYHIVVYITKIAIACLIERITIQCKWHSTALWTSFTILDGGGAQQVIEIGNSGPSQNK